MACSMLFRDAVLPFTPFLLTPLAAGVGDIGDDESSRAKDVGGSLGAVSGLIGGASTGGVALEYRWERRSTGLSLFRSTSFWRDAVLAPRLVERHVTGVTRTTHSLNLLDLIFLPCFEGLDAHSPPLLQLRDGLS